MNDKMLGQLAAVTEAQYLKEHAELRPVLEEEARLRAQLARLDAQVKEARGQGAGHAMQALGADLLWQSWHTRARRGINIQLAQVTAKKLAAMDKLRQAFGRKHAVETMEREARAKRKEAQAKRMEARLLGLE